LVIREKSNKKKTQNHTYAVNITSPQENDKQFFRESLVHQQEKSKKKNWILGVLRRIQKKKK
jgi:hypothetical protein